MSSLDESYRHLCLPVYSALFKSLFWLVDGALGEFSPNSAADLRMILSGKFLESSETLQGKLSVSTV